MAEAATKIFNDFFTTLDNKLEKPLRQHLKSVYTSLAVALFAAAIGAYIHVFTEVLKGNFLTVLVSLGCLIALYAVPHDNGRNDGKRFALLMAFAGLTGLGTGPLLDMAIQINPQIVVTAFFGTCLIFGSFTLASLYAPDRKFLYLGGILGSVLSTMFWLSLMNIFFRSRMIFQFNLYIGLIVMCGFVLYDTQLIIEKRRRGDTDYIWHSVDLFIDFMDIFRRLLIILSQREEGNKKKKN